MKWFGRRGVERRGYGGRWRGGKGELRGEERKSRRKGEKSREEEGVRGE